MSSQDCENCPDGEYPWSHVPAIGVIHCTGYKLARKYIDRQDWLVIGRRIEIQRINLASKSRIYRMSLDLAKL